MNTFARLAKTLLALGLATFLWTGCANMPVGPFGAGGSACTAGRMLAEGDTCRFAHEQGASLVVNAEDELCIQGTVRLGIFTLTDGCFGGSVSFGDSFSAQADDDGIWTIGSVP